MQNSRDSPTGPASTWSRKTKRVAGAAVRMAELQAIPLSELTVADLQSLHDAFDDDVAALWSFEYSVEQRDVQGGTSRRAVREQVAALRAALA